MRESWKCQSAYESYVLLGPTRSISELAKNTNVCKTTLVKWKRLFQWDARCSPRDRKAMALIEKENDKILVDCIKKRHQEAYKNLQDKAVEQIEMYKPVKLQKKFATRGLKDSAQALDIGISGERKSLGLSDSTLKAGIVKDGFVGIVEAILKDK